MTMKMMKIVKKIGSKQVHKTQKRKTTVISTTDAQSQQINPSDMITEGVHSYFSFEKAETKPRPLSPKKNSQGLRRTQAQYSANALLNNNIHERNNQLNLPPFKIVFENQQKPPEIQVLNDLIKQNHKLNISRAFYSKYIQSNNVLLLFANDSSTYEMLFALVKHLVSKILGKIQGTEMLSDLENLGTR
ncbi:unnamed protein product [Rotaria sp. Silwood1]|nr:unnamed protein product [Rotaria sp. Silwood1]